MGWPARYAPRFQFIPDAARIPGTDPGAMAVLALGPGLAGFASFFVAGGQGRWRGAWRTALQPGPQREKSHPGSSG